MPEKMLFALFLQLYLGFSSIFFGEIFQNFQSISHPAGYKF